MARANKWVHVCALILFSWLGMMAVHECGHVLAAVATGGRIQKVVLFPLAFSRTDVSPNPKPLLVCWSGILVGAILPAACWNIVSRIQSPWVAMLRFFAGFCLVANGGYLLGGAIMNGADVADLILLGTPRWVPIIAGGIMLSLGLCMWHGLGPGIGFGRQAISPRWRQTLILIAIVVGIIVIELIFSQPY